MKWPRHPNLRKRPRTSKQLELLREIIPSLRRLAIMANPGSPAAVLEIGEVLPAARTVGLDATAHESGDPRGPTEAASEIVPREFRSIVMLATNLYQIPMISPCAHWRNPMDMMRQG